MAYSRTTWKDQIVTDPTKYRIINQDGTEEIVNIEREPGEIIQEGTKITAARLNNIEQGISDNVDGIDVLSTQMADLAQDLGDKTTLTTTDKTNLVSAINEVNAKPTADPDKGRYQAQFGFDGAELVDCEESDEGIIIKQLSPDVYSNTNNTFSGNVVTVWKSGDDFTSSGYRLTPTFLEGIKVVNSVKFFIEQYSGYDVRFLVRDLTSSTILYDVILTSSDISAESELNIDLGGIEIDDTHTIDFMFLPNEDTTFSSYGLGIYCTNNVNVTSGAGRISDASQAGSPSVDGLANASMDENYDYKFELTYQTYTSQYTTGTATVTTTPSDLKKYGNVKYTASVPVNTSVDVDILDSLDNVLKTHTSTAGENLIDLSDIDVTTYPSLKTKYTMSRNTVNDESPTVSNVSWTWEAPEKEVWEVIADITLDSDVAQVDFENLGLEEYRYLKIIGNLKSASSSTNSRLDIRFNNDSGDNYYNSSSTPTSQTSVTIEKYATNVFSRIVLEINNIDVASHKVGCKSEIANATTSQGQIIGFRWANTTELINSVNIDTTYGIKANSTFTLLGVK